MSLPGEIQERLRIETALVQSEDKFRTLVNQLPVGVYRTTAEGSYIQVNQALAHIFGIEEVEDMMKMNANSFFDSFEYRDRVINEMMQHKEVHRLEYESRKIDGSRIWVRDTGRALYKDNNEIDFFDGIIEDITERRNAQLALKESEEKYRILFEKLHDVFFRIGINGTFIVVSPSAKEVLGYIPQELIGRNVNELIENNEEIAKFFKIVNEKGSHNNYIFKAKRKDNKTVFLSTDAYSCINDDGSVDSIEGIARDITSEIKQQTFLSVLFSISKAISSSENVDELYENIYDSISRLTEVKNFYIALYDDDENKLNFAFIVDQYDTMDGKASIDCNDMRFLSPRVLKSGKTLILNEEELKEHAKYLDNPPVVAAKTWLGIPLKAKDKTIGIIILHSYSSANAFSQDDIGILESVADQIAIAIDHKKSQMELDHQYEFMQNLIDTIPNSVYYKDAKTLLYSGCNKAFAENLNIRREDIIGKTSYDIFPASKAMLYHQKDIEILENKTIQQFEDVFENADGMVENHLVFRSCYFDENNEVAGIAGIIVDVTEISKAEEEARTAKDYAELLNRVTPSCIFTVDKNRTITSWNERIAATTGFSAIEKIGKKCDLCSSYQDYECCALFDDNYHKPIYGNERCITTKSGQERTISINIDLIKNSSGEIIGGIETFEDVTERKEIEEALFWEAAANSAFADLARAVISLASISEISQLILDLAQQLTSAKFGFVGYIDQQTGYLVVPTYTKEGISTIVESSDDFVFAGFKGLWGWSLQNRASILTNSAQDDPRSTGTPDFHFTVEKFLATPATLGNSLVGQIALANSDRDFTERDLEIVERMASLFAVALERVRSEVEVRTALEKEQELGELKSNFISMVSHEYRTPLQAILMSTQLLSDYGSKLSDEHKLKYFEIINKSVKTMDSLLEDIIVYNKIDQGKVEIALEEQDLEQFCINFTYEMQYLAKDKCHIDLSLNKGSNKTVRIDEKLLREALVNLFTNAIKYSDDNSTIDFNVRVNNGEVNFEVKDYGKGISEEDQRRIFEPFFRGKNVGNTSGTGLGLAIVKNAVEIHGGRIEINSSLGEGTSVTVTVPIK